MSLSEKHLDEFLALFIAGVCYGHIENTYEPDQVTRVIQFALAVVAGTVLLGASVKFNKNKDGKNWMTYVVEAEKSVWPFAVFLMAFTIVPSVIEFLIGLVSKWFS